MAGIKPFKLDEVRDALTAIYRGDEYASTRLRQRARPPCFIPRQKTEKYAKATA